MCACVCVVGVVTNGRNSLHCIYKEGIINPGLYPVIQHQISEVKKNIEGVWESWKKRKKEREKERKKKGW